MRACGCCGQWVEQLSHQMRLRRVFLRIWIYNGNSYDFVSHGGSSRFQLVFFYYHFKWTNEQKESNIWAHLRKGPQSTWWFFIRMYRIVSFRFPCGKHLCIQKSNCWTDRTICLNKTDANVGECVRAYIHAYVQMIMMCVCVSCENNRKKPTTPECRVREMYFMVGERWLELVFFLSLSILQPCVFGLPLTTAHKDQECVRGQSICVSCV